jgi:hypothetical protein
LDFVVILVPPSFTVSSGLCYEPSGHVVDLVTVPLSLSRSLSLSLSLSTTKSRRQIYLFIYFWGLVLCCSQSGDDLLLEDLAKLGYKINTKV